MYQLSFEETHSLLRQPESGMGYQVVDALTKDYRRKRGSPRIKPLVRRHELLTLVNHRPPSADTQGPVTFHRWSVNSSKMMHRRLQPSWPESSNELSGKPVAVQLSEKLCIS